MLHRSDQALARRYDIAVLDLDGVVYVGPHAVPGVPEALTRARAAGMRLAFITNNAARTPTMVAEHLRELGVDAHDDDVVTSAQAAARLCAQTVPEGSAVYVIGGEGLEVALRERGLRPVTSPEDDPVAVVQGYGPEMPWRRVVLGAILVRDGLPWIASNTDMTIPTSTGIGPGNGALVDLVTRYAGRPPQVAGKPERPLFEETLLRVGGQRPLVIGDRLDTDIAGARAMGWDSLLVMTGVTGTAELVAAPPEQRPTYLAADLGGLLTPAIAPEEADDGWTCGGWRATIVDEAVEVTGEGAPDDWWRVVAVAAWAHRDESGRVPQADRLAPPGSLGA
ncbi:MAG TPA: HAD-IIA family hydrolase [Marmoricola sp.]|nr:HAD-IIA family hydrolase [Marmoricola sp.]